MKSANNIIIIIVQSDIFWEDKVRNLAQYEQQIAGIQGQKEIVVLPEMFSTGFSMAPERLAEPMDGPTVAWMRETAANNRIILCGSLIIEEGGRYLNRLIWMQPDGTHHHYDKRHLFAYGEEDQHYEAGNRKLIVQVKGWKICPLICYDLRFPVWSRYTPDTGYDVLLYVANWPEKRSTAWKTLLQARAIENQAYCIGVNRVGTDGKGLRYSGDSSVFDPLGQCLWQQSEEAAVQTIVLQRDTLEDTRNALPFLKDADSFILTDQRSS